MGYFGRKPGKRVVDMRGKTSDEVWEIKRQKKKRKTRPLKVTLFHKDKRGGSATRVIGGEEKLPSREPP